MAKQIKFQSKIKKELIEKYTDRRIKEFFKEDAVDSSVIRHFQKSPQLSTYAKTLKSKIIVRNKIIECCDKALVFLEDAKKVGQKSCLILSSFAVEEFGKAVALKKIFATTLGSKIPGWLLRDHDKKYKAGMAYLKERGCRDVFEFSVYISSNIIRKAHTIQQGNCAVSITPLTTGLFSDTTHTNAETLPVLSPKNRQKILHVGFERASHDIQIFNTEKLPRGLIGKLVSLPSADIEKMINCIRSFKKNSYSI